MNISTETPPRIYYQGVDTLRTAHVFKHFDNWAKYEELLDYLFNMKQRAIEANANYEYESGITFEFKSYGKFFIRPKGQGRYKYVIYNQDIEMYFSTVQLGSNDYNTPQITIDFRARYLSLLGHQAAYDQVRAMLENLFQTDEHFIYDHMFKTQMMRIDLCTDIGGIDYTPADKYRFQTNFKNHGHIEFKEHMQYNRLTGFSFGKGDYMMRIYNKRHQLNNDPSKLWLVALWVQNGYSETIRPSVWRHEVQLRRPYLKRFRLERVNDEVEYFFNMLPNLWTFAFSKVRFVDVPTDKVIRIMEGQYTPEALKKVFQFAKKNGDNKVWSMAESWRGIFAPPPEKIQDIKSSDMSIAKRFYKAFISTAYKSVSGDPSGVIRIMELVQEELYANDGITLHDYGSNKLLDTFIDNAQLVTEYGLVVEKDYRLLATRLYADMMEKLVNIGNVDFDRSEARLASVYNVTVEELRANINDFLLMESETSEFTYREIIYEE